MCRLCPRVRLVEWSVLVLLAFSVSSASSLWAQQADDKTGKEEKTLSSLKDGWPIHVTYYPSRLKKNSAVVVDKLRKMLMFKKCVILVIRL